MEDIKGYEQEVQQKQLKQLLKESYHDNTNLEFTAIVEQIKLVEQYSLDSKRILGLFSNPDFGFKYISQNVIEIVGFYPEDIYNGGLSFSFKSAYWKHWSLPIKIFQWGSRFRKLTKHVNAPHELINFFCGVKMKDSEGKLKTFFIKQKILSYSQKNQALLSFMEIEDITAIFKQDFVWSRMTKKSEKESFVRAFFSRGQKKECADLLSDREKQILQLVVEQKNNVEISKLLGITKNTVERHRKNMIARLGVVDMTSLIYVCRLCNFI